jgi:hypothetical protein
MSSTDEVARWAPRLGLGGLIPFIALSLAAWGPWPDWSALAVRAQVLYGVTILTFVGALHWGFAFRAEPYRPSGMATSMIWSVVPSLYAWGVANLRPQWSLPLLALGLAVAWAVDRRLYPPLNLPHWFIRLRTWLTAGASACLLLTWAAIRSA